MNNEIWIKLMVPVLIGINLAAFIMYWMDKRAAIRHSYRVPNRTLLLLAACGGSLGALLGMLVFRHKTRTWYYVVTVPILLALHTFLFVKLLL